MKSAILITPGALEIDRDAPRPKTGPGEVVVKVKAALTCGTDIKTYLRGHPKIPLPSPLGHEFSGDIVSIGEGVAGWEVGEAVMAVHSAPCGECSFCLMGRENLCSAVMDEKVLGAYAEYILLPARIVKRNLYRKPDTLSYQEAAMLEPLSCVVHGMRAIRRETWGSTPDPAGADGPQTPITIGLSEQGPLAPAGGLGAKPSTALILGAGPIGLLHLMLAKSRGQRVIVAGRREERLAMARAFGADAVIDTEQGDIARGVMDATGGLGADLVIEAAGSRELWEASPSLARRGGTVLLFGGCPPGTKACFDAGRIHYDEITLAGAFHFTPADVKESYELLASGRIDVKPLISGEFPLDDLQKAFDALIAGRGIKYVILP